MDVNFCLRKVCLKNSKTNNRFKEAKNKNNCRSKQTIFELLFSKQFSNYFSRFDISLIYLSLEYTNLRRIFETHYMHVSPYVRGGHPSP